MKRVAIYVRVSTEDQSLEHQRAALVEKCKREGWAYCVFEEKASGANAQRTALDQMMRQIRAKQFDAILVLKIDRLGRSLKHLIQIIEELRNRNIQFICMSPDVDTESAQGRFFLQIMGAVAELERQMIRERTIAKLKYLKRKGVRLGRPPGSRDKRPRRRTGYLATWHKRKSLQQLAGEDLAPPRLENLPPPKLENLPELPPEIPQSEVPQPAAA